MPEPLFKTLCCEFCEISKKTFLKKKKTEIEKIKKKPYSKEKVNIRVTLYMLSKISLSTSEILIKIYEHLCSSVKKS